MLALRGIDLFCGSGGFAYGMQSAGVKIIRSLDHDPAVIDIHRANIKDVKNPIRLFRPPVKQSIAKAGGKSQRGRIHKSHLPHHVADLLAVIDIAPEIALDRPDIIFGGPPCQPFSAAGKGEGDKSPLSSLTEAFAILVAAARPRYFVMENVKGLRNSEVYRRARAIFERGGYGLTETVLNASYFGTPQNRERLILAGCLDETDGWLHAYLNQYKSREPMTVADLLGNDFGTQFEDFALDPECSDLVSKDSSEYKSYRLRKRDLKCLSERDPNTRFYYRSPGGAASGAIQRTDRPSPTLIRTSTDRLSKNYRPTVGDPVDLRKLQQLTFHQFSRLTGYPEWWDWKLPSPEDGGLSETEAAPVGGSRQQMLANSVPPPLAQAIGRAIVDHARRMVPANPIEPKAIAEAEWRMKAVELKRYKRWLETAKGLRGKDISQELSDLRAAKKLVHVRKLGSAEEELRAFNSLPATAANRMSIVRRSQLRKALVNLAEFELFQTYVRAELFPDDDLMYARGAFAAMLDPNVQYEQMVESLQEDEKPLPKTFLRQSQLPET
ncbi:DNA cytosine methyltransferase [Chelativorans sp. Marseille-P2723]|uniref:DNA cytosine methyltransferase n=1 Tax=Chelativorans sp. Marseille-P2723 TaxID=2709133 RepID=UPI00156D9625|nr:DNA cytosine methyltransferase [Chelativorans sp. Marseille-P2723]